MVVWCLFEESSFIRKYFHFPKNIIVNRVVVLFNLWHSNRSSFKISQYISVHLCLTKMMILIIWMEIEERWIFHCLSWLHFHVWRLLTFTVIRLLRIFAARRKCSRNVFINCLCINEVWSFLVNFYLEILLSILKKYCFLIIRTIYLSGYLCSVRKIFQC